MSWVNRDLHDGANIVTSRDTVAAYDIPQLTQRIGQFGPPLFVLPVQVATRAQAIDLPQNLLGSRVGNLVLFTIPPTAPTVVRAFDLPQKFLNTRTLGLRLVTRPTTFPYSSDISIDLPQRMLGTRGGINLLPDEFPPPWWSPIPDGIRKWNLYPADRKWSNSTDRRFSYKVRGAIQ